MMCRRLLSWLIGERSPIVWALAAVAINWLRREATVWEWAAGVYRGDATVRDFVTEAQACDRCSTYWFTTPLLAAGGPVRWLAANGLYLLFATHYPTVQSDDDPEV